jgi:hypothetical protein
MRFETEDAAMGGWMAVTYQFRSVGTSTELLAGPPPSARLRGQRLSIARSSVALGVCQPTIAPCAAIIASAAALNSGK